MRVKEINVGLSATIPTAPYENLKPNYSMTIELTEGDSHEDAFSMASKYLHNLFEIEVNKAKVDLIEKQYQNIRFRERNGKKYPGVTSIVGWDKEWRITDDELMQYASRGTIVHTLIDMFINSGEWADPEESPELKDDVRIVLTGSLHLHWDDCTHKKFFEKYAEEFEFYAGEVEIFNDEHLYSGRYDRRASYKGKLSIVDWKTGSYDMKQLAAYAVCDPDVEQLIVCPVGATDNKSGYKKPDVTTQIESNFKLFLKDRMKFRERFGI